MLPIHASNVFILKLMSIAEDQLARMAYSTLLVVPARKVLFADDYAASCKGERNRRPKE